MNRRGFLKFLGASVASVALGTFRAAEIVAPLREKPQWYAYQTDRKVACYNAEYLEVLDSIMCQAEWANGIPAAFFAPRQ